jgi:hypothetical protein
MGCSRGHDGGIRRLPVWRCTMAKMIRIDFPRAPAPGNVFAVHRQLPDDVIVYDEPVLADRYPTSSSSFRASGCSSWGWYPNAIGRADDAEAIINARGRREVCKHQVRQASGLQFPLMDVARRHPETGACLNNRARTRASSSFRSVTSRSSTTAREQLDERGLSNLCSARPGVRTRRVRSGGGLARHRRPADDWFRSVVALRALQWLRMEFEGLYPSRFATQELESFRENTTVMGWLIRFVLSRCTTCVMRFTITWLSTASMSRSKSAPYTPAFKPAAQRAAGASRLL